MSGLLLVLFVPDGDISPSLKQQLTDAWMTHLGCQHQRCPAILEKNQRCIRINTRRDSNQQNHMVITQYSPIQSHPKNQFVSHFKVKKAQSNPE